MTCDDYKGNRNEFHSVAEIPRECILETFLLKQTDSALGFFLSFVSSLAHPNDSVHDHILYECPQKVVSEKETNLANATIICKHGSVVGIYCFQSRHKKG